MISRLVSHLNRFNGISQYIQEYDAGSFPASSFISQNIISCHHKSDKHRANDKTDNAYER